MQKFSILTFGLLTDKKKLNSTIFNSEVSRETLKYRSEQHSKANSSVNIPQANDAKMN